MIRVLGIDPGYERLGVAVVEKKEGYEELLFSDCITTLSSEPFEQRLVTLGSAIQKIIKKYKPEHLAIEKTFFNTNQKTAVEVSQARGVVLVECGRANMSVYEYSPPQIKLAVTGYGHSDKKQVISMVERLIKVEKKIAHDDEYDAIAVALTHIASYRRSQ